MGKQTWYALIGILIISGLFSLVGLIAYLLYGPGVTVVVPDFFGSTQEGTTTEEVAIADPLTDAPGTLFECDEERALKALFSEGKVALVLSDGRALSLPQVVSASGMRYANTDESFVFHTKDYGAYVEEVQEDGVRLRADCVMKP